MQLARKVARALMGKNLTLAVAESCTGGLLSHRLTNIPGSTKYFVLGITSYSNESKITLLNVSPSVLLKHGAVSRNTATAMAKGVRSIQGTDWGVGITGIAGPSGATPKKPVGLTFISLASRDRIICQKFIFKGSRLRIKSQAANRALSLLLKALA